MGHGMLDRKDDHPTASSMGFGATTTTTRSLGVSGVEADDDDGVELVSETQKIKKDPTKITWKHVLWEDPHCCTAYTQAESLDKEAQGRRYASFWPYGGSGSADHAHVTGQMPVNWVLSSGGKEDLLMTAEMVVGSASADDCDVL